MGIFSRTRAEDKGYHDAREGKPKEVPYEYPERLLSNNKDFHRMNEANEAYRKGYEEGQRHKK